MDNGELVLTYRLEKSSLAKYLLGEEIEEQEINGVLDSISNLFLED